MEDTYFDWPLTLIFMNGFNNAKFHLLKCDNYTLIYSRYSRFGVLKNIRKVLFIAGNIFKEHLLLTVSLEYMPRIPNCLLLAANKSSSCPHLGVFSRKFFEETVWEFKIPCLSIKNWCRRRNSEEFTLPLLNSNMDKYSFQEYFQISKDNLALRMGD